MEESVQILAHLLYIQKWGLRGQTYVGMFLWWVCYAESPKILNTIVSDKMAYANCADPD